MAEEDNIQGPGDPPATTVMPPVDVNHRNFNASGQANPIVPQPANPDVQNEEPGNLLPAPRQQATTPDKKLYDYLSQNQLYSKTYGDFQKQFNNQQSIDKLHDFLSDTQLYSKSKDDFTNQFFSHLPPKDVSDAQSYIDNYLNSPKANMAINKITADKFYNDFGVQQAMGGKGKQDATAVNNIPPTRLPDWVQSDRDNYRADAAQNPDLYRPVLTVAKRQNPQDAPQIDAAMYTADANTRPHDPAAVKYYADQMRAGNMQYDIKNKQIIKPEGTIDAIFHGMKDHSDAMDEYDFFTSHNDQDIINHLNENNKNYDPDKPVSKAIGTLPSIGNMIGGNVSAMAKMSASKALPAAILTGPEGEFALAAANTLGMGAAAQDFHHVAYANTLGQTYRELMDKHPDIDPQTALNEAKSQANFSGALSMGQGLLMGEAGAKTEAPEFAPVRYKAGFTKALSDVAANSGKLIKSIAPDIGTQSAIAGGLKAIENAHQGKPIGEGTTDAAMGAGLFMAGLGALRAPDVFLSSAGRANLMDGYAAAPESSVDNSLSTMVAQGTMKPEDAVSLKQELAAHKVLTEDKLDTTSPLTPEGEHFMQSVDNGERPSVMTKNLEKIAKDNGVEPAEGEELTPQKIINALQKKRDSVKLPDTLVSTKDQMDAVSEKLPDIYKNMYNEDPDKFTQFIADQVHSGNRTEVEQIPGITKTIIDAAIAKHPEHILSSPKIENNGQETEANAQTEGQVADNSAGQQTAPLLESRHADTIHDEKGIVSGPNDKELSPDGKRDANDLANDVKDKGVTKIISSDLERAKETAQKVSDKTGASVEHRPELNTWDIGQFDGTKDAAFKPIQKYFVDHPDETEYEGKKLGESFNQYKDRIIKARTELEKEPSSTLLINHSNNMMLWDAYIKNGRQWNEQAAKDYVNSKTPEPATLVNNKPHVTVSTPNIVNVKLKDNAIQEPETSSVLQREQGQVGSQGSGRERMEQGQQGTEITQESTENKNKSEGETIGIAHESRQTRADKLGQTAPERGEGRSPEELIEHGRQLLSHGVDPETSVSDFKKSGKISEDDMSVVRAKYEQLGQETNRAVEQFGEGSKQDKAAQKAESDWYNHAVKPMQTAWSNIGRAQQGETDIDTGSFVGIRRAFKEQTGGKDFTPTQMAQAKELSGKVKELTDKVSDLENKLTDTINKAVGNGKEKATYKDKAKAYADAFRKLKTKPFTFKDENGNDIDVTKAGIGWNDIVEAGAKIIEKTGEIADGVAEVIKNIKDTDWYKGLSDSDKDRFAKQLEQHYQDEAPGIAIATDPTKLAEKFAEKSDSKFEPKDAKDIWNYAKTEYLNKGASFDDMISGVAMDLGLSAKQVREAITSPKGAKAVSDEMYFQQYKQQQAIRDANLWLKTAEKSKFERNAIVRFAKSLPNVFFTAKVFGHGTVGSVTHSGMNAFVPRNWKIHFGAMAKSWKYSFGGTTKKGLAAYQQEMTDLTHEPDFAFWKRNRLAVDPVKSYDDYQQFAKGIAKLGEMGDRGFNALKIERLGMARLYYDKLSDLEKSDPETAKNIASIVNHSTGTADVPVPKLIGNAIFAPRLEASRWSRLIVEPGQAIKTLYNWKEASPSDKVAAKIVAKRAGTMFATYMSGLAANSAALTIAGSSQSINYTDPTKYDWLKFKAGDKVLDMSGGMVSAMRFVGSLVAEGFGERKKVRGVPEGRAETMEKTAGNYVRGKLSPFASTATDIATQSDFSGRPLPFSSDEGTKFKPKYTWREYIEDQQLPIPVSEGFKIIHDQMKDNGANEADINQLLNGIISGAISGTSGARVGTDYDAEKKDKKSTIPSEPLIPTNYK